MRWSNEAQEALSRVPFFVRRRVRKRVEEEAARRGAGEVTLEHVKAAQRRFLERMEEEVRGYRIETCFGPSGCPNRALPDQEDGDLPDRLERILESSRIRHWLKDRISGPLKLHHEFRVCIADCPNACSRPQIADVGLMGARSPKVADPEACSECGACQEVCEEEAVEVREGRPLLHKDRCLSCGACIRVCPTGALQEESRGYRVLVGGKLGRHPQLARELPGIHGPKAVEEILRECLRHYKDHCIKGERFGEILKRVELEVLIPEERD
jgi:dissimilatory sulfite reductase (desulfoviridin) alpha/beta subunit